MTGKELPGGGSFCWLLEGFQEGKEGIDIPLRGGIKLGGRSIWESRIDRPIMWKGDSLMLLQTLKLHNFRCFSDIRADFRERLTVLVGGNGKKKQK